MEHEDYNTKQQRQADQWLGEQAAAEHDAENLSPDDRLIISLVKKVDDLVKEVDGLRRYKQIAESYDKHLEHCTFGEITF